MKRKTSDLIDAGLDWAAAIANGVKPEEIYISGASIFRRLRGEDGKLDGRYMTGPDLLFSRKWEAGGPIIEREGIGLKRGLLVWVAFAFNAPRAHSCGPTPLVAAMRCFVASKLGDEVDVPEELLP